MWTKEKLLKRLKELVKEFETKENLKAWDMYIQEMKPEKAFFFGIRYAMKDVIKVLEKK